MGQLSKHHQELTNGRGKCSVPMWMSGCPAGFCDQPASGHRPESKEYMDGHGTLRRMDGKYAGYVPGFACPAHGGPPLSHYGDPCIYCGIAHDDVPPGSCTGTALLAARKQEETET